MRGGVLAEIGRQIGDADAIMRKDLTAPKRRWHRLILHVTLGTLQLIGGPARQE
jgi:hypothetical protein